jgi:hypothetical protein
MDAISLCKLDIQDLPKLKELCTEAIQSGNVDDLRIICGRIAGFANDYGPDHPQLGVLAAEMSLLKWQANLIVVVDNGDCQKKFWQLGHYSSACPLCSVFEAEATCFSCPLAEVGARCDLPNSLWSRAAFGKDKEPLITALMNAVEVAKQRLEEKTGGETN